MPVQCRAESGHRCPVIRRDYIDLPWLEGLRRVRVVALLHRTSLDQLLCVVEYSPELALPNWAYIFVSAMYVC